MPNQKDLLRTKTLSAQAKKRQANGEAPEMRSVLVDFSEMDPTGEPTRSCDKCGNLFDQDFYPDRNSYSAFKTCQSCRAKLARKKEEDVKSNDQHEVSTLMLPFDMFPWQVEARDLFRSHRFSVWDIGNRGGKDFTANMIGIEYFVECLNENRAVEIPTLAPSVLWWIVAPDYKLAKQNWRDLKKQFPREWVVALDNTNMIMETIAGGVIEVRSAYDPEQLVAAGVDLCTITEGARIKDLLIVVANVEARLNSPHRGLVRDRNGMRYGQGKMIINSTPIGKNQFYQVFCWGKKDHPDYSSNWVSIQHPWTCNLINAELADTIVRTKYGEVTYAQDLERRLGTRLYRQNYMADFLASDGTVFKDFEDKCVTNIFSPVFNLQQKEDRDKYSIEWRATVTHHRYRIGYDPATGSATDSPVFAIRDMYDNKIVQQFDMFGKNYDEQWDMIAYWSRRYNHAPCAWLRTGHTAIEGQLSKRGVSEIPLNEQGENKRMLVQSLEIAVQNNDVKVLIDGNVDAQTLVYQMNDYSEVDGKYSNMTMEHDDFVSALYACYFDYSIKEAVIPYMGIIRQINI